MITAIILASGFSRRMGEDKLLMKIGGKPLVEWVIREIKQSNVEDIILIYRKFEVKDIGLKYNIKTVFNENAHLGQSEALKLGIKNSKPDTNAYMFFVGDQLFINKYIINLLMEEYQKTTFPILIPCYDGKEGNPVVFSSILRSELLKIDGDRGGKVIIEKHPKDFKKIHIKNGKIGLDIDTPKDFKKIKEVTVKN